MKKRTFYWWIAALVALLLIGAALLGHGVWDFMRTLSLPEGGRQTLVRVLLG